MPTITFPTEPVTAEVPYGHDDAASIYIKDTTAGEKDFTENLLNWNLIMELNRLEVIELTLIGLESSDFTSYVKRDNILKLFAEQEFVCKFRIEEVNRENDYITKIR